MQFHSIEQKASASFVHALAHTTPPPPTCVVDASFSFRLHASVLDLGVVKQQLNKNLFPKF